jgi:hypothetical protein
MRAITLWQPWASLILAGAKIHETRSWRIPPKLLGTRIAIHAGMGKAPARMVSPALEELCGRIFGPDWRRGLPLGRMICTCVLEADEATADVLGTADADDVASGIWTPGRRAWRLTDVTAIDDPEQVSGLQGFWTHPRG